MKLAQYTQREAQIKTTDQDGIRQRWLWGLRLLHDPDAFNQGSTQLKPGVGEDLTKAAAKRDIKLSEREIQRRLQCARRYPTEAEFRLAQTEFQTWSDLYNAGFPARPATPGEPLADWRTEAEKFAATFAKRRAYLDDLENAVGGDMSATWEQAQQALDAADGES